MLRGGRAALLRIDVSRAGRVVATLARIHAGSAEEPPLDFLDLWDLETGHPLGRIGGTDHRVSDFDLAPEGRTLATTAFDAPPVLWDVRTGRRVRELAPRPYRDVRFVPRDGRVLLAGPGALLVDIGTGHTRTLALDAVDAVSPDGRLVATADRNVRLRTLTGDSLLLEIGPARDRLRLHGPHVTGAEFHPDGGRVLTGGFILAPTVYDLRTGDTVAVYPVPDPTSGDIVAVFGRYSPDGRRVLTRIETGTDVWIWRVGASPGAAPEAMLESDSPVVDAAFSGDGALLLSAHADGSTRVREVASGKERFRRYRVGEDG